LLFKKIIQNNLLCATTYFFEKQLSKRNGSFFTSIDSSYYSVYKSIKIEVLRKVELKNKRQLINKK